MLCQQLHTFLWSSLTIKFRKRKINDQYSLQLSCSSFALSGEAALFDVHTCDPSLVEPSTLTEHLLIPKWTASQPH